MSRRKGVVLISALSDADRHKVVKKEEEPVVSTQVAILDDWYCHCCRARNKGDLNKCKVCGRDSSFALKGYSFPLHGDIGLLWRPNQLRTVLNEVNEEDGIGWTALHQAVAYRNIEAVKELIAMDCIVDAATSKGLAAIHIATMVGAIDIVKLLVKAGAKYTTPRPSDWYTPLHIACEHNYKDIAKFYVELGVDVNCKDRLERTPLHVICSIPEDRVDLASYLIKNGADDRQMDVHGWNPRQVAELAQNRQIQELIVRNQMTEKMPVISKLPKAQWHDQLWDEVVGGYQNLRVEAKQAIVNEENMKIEVQRLLKQFEEERKEKKRQEEIEKQELEKLELKKIVNRNRGVKASLFEVDRRVTNMVANYFKPKDVDLSKKMAAYQALQREKSEHYDTTDSALNSRRSSRSSEPEVSNLYTRPLVTNSFTADGTTPNALSIAAKNIVQTKFPSRFDDDTSIISQISTDSFKL